MPVEPVEPTTTAPVQMVEEEEIDVDEIVRDVTAKMEGKLEAQSEKQKQYVDRQIAKLQQELAKVAEKLNIAIQEIRSVGGRNIGRYETPVAPSTPQGAQTPSKSKGSGFTLLEEE